LPVGCLASVLSRLIAANSLIGLTVIQLPRENLTAPADRK
jgi:uncharacterized membrane protein